MILKHSALCLIFATGLTACASGPAVQTNAADSLTAYFYNDSTGAMLLKGGLLHTFSNARCEGGRQLAHSMSLADQEAIATIPVTPGTPFTFALTTTNAQSFKGNWGCSFTSTFTPVAGARYTATLQSADDNGVCSVTITDQNNKIVPTTSPDYSCAGTLGGIVKNGTRWFLR